MTNEDTIPTYGKTWVEIYGHLFRRGVRFDMARGFYLIKPEKVELGQDMIAAYEATKHLPENSGGKD